MNAALRYAIARLRVRRTRTILSLLGIVAAGAMLGAAITVAYGLGTGFERTANRADLPDIAATFAPLDRERVDRVVRSLPNVASSSYRLQRSVIYLASRSHETNRARVIGVEPGRRHGYAIVEGRDLTGPRETVIEVGLARAWKIHLGDELFAEARNIDVHKILRVVGIALSPDGVAFPLASSPRFYTSTSTVAEMLGTSPDTVDTALIWLADPSRVDITLSQARAAGFGVDQLRFGTRSALKVLIGQAAGLVIALLVAFSLVSLLVAGTMLAASSAAEVQRRLQAIGLLRAVGMSTAKIVAASAIEGAVIGGTAGLIGIGLGWLLVNGPSTRLLESLNQLGPGVAVMPLLALALLLLVVLVAGGAAWPTWRAARRPAIETLRGADVVGVPRNLPLPSGAFGLGLRLSLARPIRTVAAALVLGLALSVVLLVLAIASVLRTLNDRPQALGTRYQLNVVAAPSEVSRIQALPGVEDAAPRFDIPASDSFQLGEPFRIIAYPGDHTRFEDPVLESGRHLAADDEAEIGLGLSHALGLHVGGTLAAQLATGQEVRFTVVGIVRAFQDQGRIVFARPARLHASGDLATVAVKVARGSTVDDVRVELQQRGYFAVDSGGIAGQNVQGFASRSSGFLSLLIALLRSVAVVNGAVCLYAIAQVLALTAHERRRSLAVVRSFGANRRQVVMIFAGAALAVIALAVPIGLLVERYAVGPFVASLAASYISLPLSAGPVEIGAMVALLGLGAAAVALGLARGVTSRPVVTDLAEE